MISRPAVIPSLYMIHLWSLTLAARTTAAAAETLLLPDLLSIIYNWIKTAQSQSRKPTIAPSSELWRTTLTLLLQKRNNNVNARHHTNTSPAESQKITPSLPFGLWQFTTFKKQTAAPFATTHPHRWNSASSLLIRSQHIYHIHMQAHWRMVQLTMHYKRRSRMINFAKALGSMP